ncbi:hypothetical protein Btru_026392 [Bulinus truncatus]|nr:hypothetical protein Btru_026392 [Bulinus truncatus]
MAGFVNVANVIALVYVGAYFGADGAAHPPCAYQSDCMWWISCDSQTRPVCNVNTGQCHCRDAIEQFYLPNYTYKKITC